MTRSSFPGQKMGKGHILNDVGGTNLPACQAISFLPRERIHAAGDTRYVIE